MIQNAAGVLKLHSDDAGALFSVKRRVSVYKGLICGCIWHLGGCTLTLLVQGDIQRESSNSAFPFVRFYLQIENAQRKQCLYY